MASESEDLYPLEGSSKIVSTEWAKAIEPKTYDQSVEDLLDAYNDLDYTFRNKVIKQIDRYGIIHYETDYHSMAAMCTDVDVIYAESGAIMFNTRDNLSKYTTDDRVFNNYLFKQMGYLRNACSHHYGSYTPADQYLYAIEYDILGQKPAIRRMLRETLKRHSESQIEGKIKSFNPKKAGFRLFRGRF